MTSRYQFGLSSSRGWLVALGIAAIAILIRMALQPLLGDNLQFVVAFPAVAIAAALVGTGAGFLVALACMVVVVVPVLPPNLPPENAPLQAGTFILAAIVVSLAVGAKRESRFVDELELGAAELRPDPSLLRWLRAVFLGSIWISIAAFVVAGWWGFDLAESEAKESAARASEIVLRHATRTFQLAGEVAHRADRASLDIETHDSAVEPSLHQRLADLAGIPSIVNLDVWDANGRAIARSDVFPTGSEISIADRDYFIEQRSHPDRTDISGVVRGRQTGIALINVTVARVSSSGKFLGVVTASLSPKFFQDYYQSLAHDDARLASFSLVKADGEVLAEWPSGVTFGQRVPAEDQVFQEIQSGKNAGELVVSADGFGDSRILSYRRVGSFPLYVTAGFGQKAMLAGWRRFLLVLAAIVFPIAFCLAYVSRIAVQRVRQEHLLSLELQQQVLGRARAEKTAIEGQKLQALAQLTGGVAHDFNNLLAIISNSLHIQKHLHPEQAAERQLDAMTRAIQAGVRLTRQLLSFSRRQALQPERVDLKVWLPSAEGLLQSTVGPAVRLTHEVDVRVAEIFVDISELELALINLTLNSRHAMPNGGEIRISAAAATDRNGREQVLLSVEDNGAGIEPELLPRVFEPFFTTRSLAGGSGLGLSQVYGFCQQAGGDVTIESSIGKGTKVILRFPAMVQDRQELSANASANAEPLSGHILLVEDNAEVASATAEVLRIVGLHVTHFASASEALQYLARCAVMPDAVLSDIEMPGEFNGISLAFLLQTQYPKLPVVLMTGYASQLDEARRGGLLVIPKPVPPDVLIEKLRSLMTERA